MGFRLEFRVQGVYDQGFAKPFAKPFVKPFVKVKPRRQPTQLPTGMKLCGRVCICLHPEGSGVFGPGTGFPDEAEVVVGLLGRARVGRAGRAEMKSSKGFERSAQ